MSISATAFTNGAASSASSATTASKTWVSGRLYFMWVLTTPTVPTVTVGSTAWTQIRTDNLAVSGLQWTVLCFLGDGSTGAATISCGTSQSEIQWTCDEFQGTVTTGTNGSNAVVQSNSANGSGTTPAATLVSFGDPINNAVYAGNLSAAGATGTAKSGYTALASNLSFYGLFDEYQVGQDTAPSMTLGGPGHWIFTAMELKAHPSGPSAAVLEYYRSVYDF